MSYARYLQAIAETLHCVVEPKVDDAATRSTLSMCVRALAGLASLLERPSADAVDSLLSLHLPDHVRLGRDASEASPGFGAAWLAAGPAEDAAARGPLADSISVAAGWLDRGVWLDEPSLLDAAKAIVAWEKSQLDTIIATMTQVETLPPSDNSTLNLLLIDRAALESFFRGRLGAQSNARITSFSSATGGRSKQTAFFTLEGDTGLPKQLVVRRDHPAHPSRSVTTEYPVLEFLYEHKLKVPRPLLCEPSPAPLGAPFMVVERVEGAIAGEEYFSVPPGSEKVALNLARELGRLHALPTTEIAAHVPRSPKIGSHQERLDSIALLRAKWEELSYWPSITVSAALSWLERNVDCLDDREVIVHNDAHLHNVLAINGEVTALLDWEFVHVGHPGEDLGYCRPVVEKVTSWRTFMDAYLAGGGQPLSQRQVDYYSIRSIVQLTIEILHARSMFDTGRTKDITLVEAGASFLQKLLHRLAETLHIVLSADREESKTTKAGAKGRSFVRGAE